MNFISLREAFWPQKWGTYLGLIERAALLPGGSVDSAILPVELSHFSVNCLQQFGGFGIVRRALDNLIFR
ncbi:hypothetical protein ACFOOL_06755 [Devosia honganensis]|uniref:Uncharacterized protein n=1 Tax=Devosia honganensis TaxID=1610527 RepID=A0ABV7X110_9HYPH